MAGEWQVAEGTGWIVIPGFGRINPRRDNVAGGRQYFTITLDDGDFADVKGPTISGGPETWHYVFDDQFWLSDRGDQCLEVTISLLPGGQYAVKYRAGMWPSEPTGGWSDAAE